MNKSKFYTIEYIISMLIYGTCGIISKFVSVSSGFIVFSRAFIGSIIIILYLLIRRRKPNFIEIKKNLKWLIISGVCIGCNWICLFTSYNYVSVSVSSLCNYLAPALFIIVTIILFKEKISFLKILCVIIALIGIVLLSGIIGSNNNVNYIGVILGVGAALFYLGLLVFNRFVKDIDPIEKTLIELITVAVVTAPYAFITFDYSASIFTLNNILLLLLLGIVHTGIAYILYLGSMNHLQSQSVAIFSYFEPVIAVLLSYFLLNEYLSILGWIGGGLILGSTFVYELLNERDNKIIINNS